MLGEAEAAGAGSRPQMVLRQRLAYGRKGAACPILSQ